VIFATALTFAVVAGRIGAPRIALFVRAVLTVNRLQKHGLPTSTHPRQASSVNTGMKPPCFVLVNIEGADNVVVKNEADRSGGELVCEAGADAVARSAAFALAVEAFGGGHLPILT